MLPAPAEDPARPSASEARGNQGGVAPTNAPADPSSGIMAGTSRGRPLRLLCSPNECSGAFSIPALRNRSLASNASATQPEGWPHMGSHDEIGRPLAPCAAHTTPLARPALRRQTPEVGAECSNWARSDLSGGRSAWASLVRCECPANDHFCRMARKAVSLRRPFGDQARAVDPAPLFQAPLFRLDGILGRVLAQILCTRLIDAEPSLRGSEEKALK